MKLLEILRALIADFVSLVILSLSKLNHEKIARREKPRTMFFNEVRIISTQFSFRQPAAFAIGGLGFSIKHIMYLLFLISKNEKVSIS
jgi:hypothetical protein